MPFPSPYEAGDVADPPETAAQVSPEGADAFGRLGRLVMADPVFRAECPADATPVFRAHWRVAEAWREACRTPFRVGPVLVFIALVERVIGERRGALGDATNRRLVRLMVEITDIRGALSHRGDGS